MRARLIPEQRTDVPPGLSRRGPEPTPVTVTLAPRGRLEHTSTGALRRSLALLSAVPGADVVLDLHAVPCVDDTVASMLQACQAATADRGGHFCVRGARNQPHELLTAHGVRLAETASDGSGDGPRPSVQG